MSLIPLGLWPHPQHHIEEKEILDVLGQGIGQGMGMTGQNENKGSRRV